MRSDSPTIDAYLDELPDDRRAAVELVCARIEALTPAVSASMQHGMPFYELGGEAYVAVASQKRHVSVYVVDLDVTFDRVPELASAFAGIDRGKNCLRFRPTQLDRLTAAVLDPLIVATRDR
ncbi:MAG: DUF1801 domain-containing protein [Actinomycetota bacterium]